MKRRTVIAVSITLLILLASASYEVSVFESRGHPGVSGFTEVNLTGSLNNAFVAGSIQAFGQNNTTILVSGTSSYYKPTDTGTPALVAMNGLSLDANGSSLSNIADYYFHNGSVFGTAWNGTSWILTGEISWGNIDEGSAVILHDGVEKNLTGVVGNHFRNGGIWFDAWNGTGWLFGGNNDKRASLVAFYHGEFINYTSLLGPIPYDYWIQLLVWNGSSWLIGGHGIFGFLTGENYVDMLPESEFSGSGVLSASFGNGKWIIGGGPPAGIEIVQGSSIVGNLTMPTYFDRWVNGIAPFDGGFLAGGESSSSSGGMEPSLYFIVFAGNRVNFSNITGLLPSSFDNGQVQFLGSVSLGSVSGILIAGQGHFDETTGHSSGALVLIST